jgi:alcohol dehydrogenase (cytochrome c)
MLRPSAGIRWGTTARARHAVSRWAVTSSSTWATLLPRAEGSKLNPTRSKIFFTGGVCASALVVVAAAQQPASSPQPSGAYVARCSTCHGPTMGGATAPPILSYIRYHTDPETSAHIRETHKTLQISDTELGQVLADARILAGTNPAMATGGFTGRRGGRGGPGAGAGPAVPAAAPATAGPGGGGGGGGRGAPAPTVPANLSGVKPVTIKMADGASRTGVLLGETEIDATLLENGKYILLSREGDVYREKPIAPKADWLSYDGGVDGNRFSKLDLINTTTIKRLGAAWIYPMPTAARLEVAPIVVDGIMYLSGWNEVHALDATTGKALWMYSQARTEGIQGDGGGGANRGVTVVGDMVYMETDHAHLVAFNRFTGEKRWDIEIADYREGYSASSPPLSVGDLLITGVAGGEEGARGFVDAYRASTGERVWRWYSIPKRGEPAAETWQGQALEHGCGPTWLPGSYDPTLDLVYWAIGNPCPDINGDERLGDNLYTSSVVALSAKTGALKWYYQFSPHDTHDWDAVQPMLLVDEVWDGKPRKLLMHGDRNGMFYVLDRTNGQFLKAHQLASKVTWLKGFQKDGKPIVDPASIASREGSAVCPGLSGGANWPPASYSPQTKLFYTRVNDSCAIYTSHEDPLGTTGTRWWGRGAPSAKAQAALQELTKGYRTGVFIRAIDPFTGKKAWDLPAARTGVLSTAGGLVFTSGAGGLMALDAKTGMTVWNLNIVNAGQTAPITYMVGGKQYVTLAGGNAVVSYVLY